MIAVAMLAGELVVTAGRFERGIELLEPLDPVRLGERVTPRRAHLMSKAYEGLARIRTGPAARDVLRKALASLEAVLVACRKDPKLHGRHAGDFLDAAELAPRLGDRTRALDH